MPPCVGRRRGKQKGGGARPEMASGTRPLLRRFGSRHDELITREERVHESEHAGGTNGILLYPRVERNCRMSVFLELNKFHVFSFMI